MIGILHGSNHTNCTPTTYQSPSLFANLEYQENFEFIQRWLSIGYFMSAIEDNTLLNYMNQGNVQLENLWSIYPTSNSDIYESVFSGTYIVVFILSRYLDMYNDLVVISYKKREGVIFAKVKMNFLVLAFLTVFHSASSTFGSDLSQLMSCKGEMQNVLLRRLVRL